VHAVNVSPFWMAQATISDHDLELFSAQRKLQEKPIAVTAQIAEAYAQWLSQATGKQYRLPTEAELEYACVAGGTMPAWDRTDSRADSHVPGTAVVNAWDFFDLPDSTPEFRLDGPEESDGTRSNFELVRAGASFRW